MRCQAPAFSVLLTTLIITQYTRYAADILYRFLRLLALFAAPCQQSSNLVYREEFRLPTPPELVVVLFSATDSSSYYIEPSRGNYNCSLGLSCSARTESPDVDS